jgi:hypothetical protein
LRRVSHKITSPWTFLRAAWKQVLHIAKHKAILWRRRSKQLRVPVYFTKAPHPYTVCYRILHRLGIGFRVGVPKKRDPALVFLWEDATFVQPLKTGPRTAEWTVVNGECLDISKERVDTIHEQVFGYSLRVDPRTFTGRMVEKSNLNGVHDGREIDGPLAAPNPKSVYQRVVENLSPGEVLRVDVPSEMICDLRLLVFSGEIPLAYLQKRLRANRFGYSNFLTSIAQVSAVLEPAEIGRIVEFCRRFGLDYGEVDVVRDAADGRVYVLDINKTPLGPPKSLSAEDFEWALALSEKAFIEWFGKLGLIRQ